MKKIDYIIDEKNYTVVGINGYRKSNLTKEEALFLSKRMREQMKQCGWTGEVRVYYRDGTIVKQEE